jgi:polyhydroxyalkanoate synthase subunit PhaC
MSDSKTSPPDFRLADPAQFAQNLAKVFEQAGRIAQLLAERPDTANKELDAQVVPVEQVTTTLGTVARSYMADPQKFMDAQMRLMGDYTQLWQTTWRRFLGEPVEPVVRPEKGDRRFSDKEWQEHSVFDFLKQFYLISARWALEMVKNADGVDEHTRRKARFYVEQIANALSPSNFALTNPQVLRATLATNGANLLEGLKNLERDLKSPDGRLRIRQTDGSAFEIGKNIAVTPGKVVFRNDILELIQYAPATDKVYEVPLLFVPPWINKFYILDLNPQKSMVRWLTEQGFTVFMISWINPDEKLADKTFSDYLRDGFLAALEAVETATGAGKVHPVGYCVGGTLMATGLGYLAQRNDKRVPAATFLATQVDFEQAGDLLVYVDEDQVAWIEERMREKGYLPGRRMADAFNLLRSNDLIWSFIVNNYMLGKDPVAFDLLYWNSDGTRMPAGVHSCYLRDCYLNNRLAKGQMVVDNVRIDLSRVKAPIYNLATREDHIAPAASVFRLGRHFGGPVRFVLAASGHIAGVVNPPAANKYQYWSSEKKAGSLEEWVAGAEEHQGSWWPDWVRWLGPRSGKKVKARVPGEGGLPALEDAPGSYVRVMAD